MAGREDRMAHVLFSTAADDVGLYGKPMARNSQIWTHDFRLLLDGPRADAKALQRAAAALRDGGQFGYRFVFPAMQVGRHEVFWHRPLVACLCAAAAPEVRAARAARLLDGLSPRQARPGSARRALAALHGAAPTSWRC